MLVMVRLWSAGFNGSGAHDPETGYRVVQLLLQVQFSTVTTSVVGAAGAGVGSAVQTPIAATARITKEVNQADRLDVI